MRGSNSLILAIVYWCMYAHGLKVKEQTAQFIRASARM